MLYIVVAVIAFLFGVFIGMKDREKELRDAYAFIGVLWKRVNDRDEEIIRLAQRTVTLHDETGMAVEMPVEVDEA